MKRFQSPKLTYNSNNKRIYKCNVNLKLNIIDMIVSKEYNLLIYCIRYTYDAYRITFYSHVKLCSTNSSNGVVLNVHIIVLNLVYYHCCLRYLHGSTLMTCWSIINGILAQTLFESLLYPMQDSSCFIIWAWSIIRNNWTTALPHCLIPVSCHCNQCSQCYYMSTRIVLMPSKWFLVCWTLFVFLSTLTRHF